MEIGHYLKKARESKRLSQHEVAERLGISQKTLSNIESNKSLPTVKHLALLGEIFEIDILEILSKEGIDLAKSSSLNFKSGS